MQYPLHELASVIRSKNAGPYELTFDVIFKDAEVYEKIRQTRPFTAASFAELYKIDQSDVLNVVYFAPATAVTITIKSPMASACWENATSTARRRTRRSWTCRSRCNG